jgi:GNAT superfamily N-acetyltransferase
MPITLRVAIEDDAPAVTAIINDGASEPTSEELVRLRLHAALTGGARASVTRMVATDAAGRVTGYGHAVREDWMEPGLFWVHIAVAPDARRLGAGSALFEALREWASARGALSFRGEAYDSQPASYAFARYCGFHIERHIFESTLDLTTFDETPFTPALNSVRASGIRFLTMAEAGDTGEARRAMWEVERAVAHDIPGGSEFEVMPFETFVTRIYDTPSYDPALLFIAADGVTWIGLARGQLPEVSDGLYNGVTGVLPAWRNRGIALALKLLLIRAAIQRGAPYMRTNNDSENAPMLAVNRKLGYQPEPGYARILLNLR